MSQSIVQIYKLPHTALGTKALVVKGKHDLLHIALEVNQSKFSHWNPCEDGQQLDECDILVLFVPQCTLVKIGAVHSGSMQCILLKRDDFENSCPLNCIYSS